MAFTDHPPLPSPTWDIIITGSGIKPSLLAVALGRAGKSVLQLDLNTYYGGASTAFYSLPEAASWAGRVNDGHEAGFADASVYMAEGATGRRGYTLTLAPHLVYWQSELLRVLRGADMADSVSWQAVGSWWVWGDGEGDVAAVDEGGVTVGELGVKAAKIVVAGRRKGGWNKGRKKDAAVPAVEDPPADDTPPPLRTVGKLREVPCTFEDVAWSPTLTDRSRANLGSFLRFIAAHDTPSSPSQTLFNNNLKTPLSDFITTHFPLPHSAITALSSLTLLPTPASATKLEDAVPRLAAHFRSLGNIPEVRSAAALTVAYGGSAELCQVFSRAAAVAGGTNVLGRGISSMAAAPEEAAVAEAPKRRLTATLTNGEVVTADWIISECPPAAGGVRAVYVISGTLAPLLEKKYRDESVVPAASVVMVPGEDIGEPVYVLVRSSVTGECPAGQCMLYVATAGSRDELKAAVEKVLSGMEEPHVILFSVTYNVTGAEGSLQERPDGVVQMDGVGAGMVFEDGWVDEVRDVYQRIVGTSEGFMRLPEEARRMMEEMGDE